MLFGSTSFAQSYGEKYSIKLTAAVSENPDRINLDWDTISNALVIYIYRKLKSEQAWGSPIATISPFSVFYEDTTVTVANSYEYKIFADRSTYPDGYGYINSGIKIPADEIRGTMALMIDSIYLGEIDDEIDLLVMDLVGDGWNVVPKYVGRTESPITVKSYIQDIQIAHPDLKSTFLLGHIPVPYSGFLVPDGHTDNHYGAWPADGFYADLDGVWTDNNTYNTYGPARIQNVAGDGKFDQSSYPSSLELGLGRVDMYDLPQFNLSEIELTKKYLNKNHEFRHKLFATIERALIDDNFSNYSEGFSGNGYRNFPPLVASSNVEKADYFNSMNNGNYILSYGCGGGNYTGASGIGSTNSFANNEPQGIFTILFGSYFGDWDVSNNFLRAALGSGTILTNCWAGRPNWYFHHMGLGETIGYSAKASQNNTSDQYYPTGSYPGYVHMALMGDPSLRFHIVAPPSDLIANEDPSGAIELSWMPSQDTGVEGYYIYRSDSPRGPFERISSQAVTGTSFVDTNTFEGDNYYMVRTLKLQESASGSYYNLSQGIFQSVTCLNVNLALLLEGCYDEDLSLMTTWLNRKTASFAHRGLLPGMAPMDSTSTPTPPGQPYDIAPWHYGGTDIENTFDGPYPISVTDWVLVSFRTTPQPEDEFAKTTGLLHNDGSIQIVNPCFKRLGSNSPKELYAVVEHRNHMGIMTPGPIDISRRELTFDFRVQNSYSQAGGSGQKQIFPGVWAMYTGDIYHVTGAGYDINGQDKTVWSAENGMFEVYSPTDFNLSGEVSGSDIILWRQNNGIYSVVPK